LLVSFSSLHLFIEFRELKTSSSFEQESYQSYEGKQDNQNRKNAIAPKRVKNDCVLSFCEELKEVGLQNKSIELIASKLNNGYSQNIHQQSIEKK